MGVISSYLKTYATFDCCDEAARNGNLSELKRLHQSGHEWNEKTSYWAASSSLECLQYCHENGCPWNHETTSYAASNGRLDCLKYAVENGCQILPFAPSLASQSCDIECFKYCFTVLNDSTFWDYPHYHIDNIIDKIDLDDPIWKPLFNANLSKYPTLESKVKAKIVQLESNNDTK